MLKNKQTMLQIISKQLKTFYILFTLETVLKNYNLSTENFVKNNMVFWIFYLLK